MSPVFEPQPGDWYLSVICFSCKARILVFPDLNKGKAAIAGGYNNVVCPQCGEKRSYGKDSVEHYQVKPQRKEMVVQHLSDTHNHEASI